MTARPRLPAVRPRAGRFCRSRRVHPPFVGLRCTESWGVDPLSDVLRAVRLSGAHFFHTSASGAWGVEAARASELTPSVLPGSQHLISYHVVMSGHCWGGIEGQPPLRLEAGDVILFPHGDAHRMQSGPEPESELVPVQNVPRFPNASVFGEARDPPQVTLVCGFLGCDRVPFNPLCASLPRQLCMRGLSEGAVGLFARQVLEETRAGRAGADSMLTRLAELMFIELLRRYLDALPEGGEGWLAGVRDPLVGRALTQIHARPAHAWTLPALAQAASCSRSVLAERFAALVGLPPMQYLAHWRMQLAAARLRESSAKVATVALEVGYESEAAFSRAFKKATGSAPARWRARAES
ncbi:MAG: AraC family transcriptional regulator [Planctomycetes bacterium]|nr:AraC family transcriptional regulator [Planctomycetota bacterium]